MSMVTVKGIEGVFTPEQKRQLIRKLTDVMVEFEGEKPRSVTVIIEDVKPEDVKREDAKQEAVKQGAAAITDAIGATWCA
ncbi:tautomerase family protein [Paraburkholderia sp. 2C]